MLLGALALVPSPTKDKQEAVSRGRATLPTSPPISALQT